ncbi:hypothetical protein GOM49_05345 [Clostridium bovifaecis]|uniref:Uncharacterized protein n=1 Tax=Clostridium bovifaecis TaxID=2184719 RepID=A0A6I6EWL9_9CLOT|nr:hypothetical protein GOM49_05345 [Clostridium bovifaecis]
MNYLLKPIGEEIFGENVSIRFKTINEGFDKFKSFMLDGKDIDNGEKRLGAFIDKVFELNGEENSYVDFYFSRLDKAAKDRLISALISEDRLVLERHIREVKDETIYFRLSKESIPFLIRLSTREILFSTFYFTKFQCTIWGNFDMKFPIFFSNEDNMKLYEDIAREYYLIPGTR